MKCMKKLIIWDFDGTLVDTLTDVALCFNEALRQTGFPQHPLAAFSGFVGGNLETVVSRMLPADKVNEENITRVKTVYRELYLTSDKPNTAPYEGVMALLYLLKQQGAALAINSNKGQALLDDMVEKIFPAGWFDAVVGYVEGVPSKPNPDGVFQICKTCQVPIEQALYIGDGASDLQTAQNAGVPCILVAWGQGTEKDRHDPRIYRCVQTVKELEQLLTSEAL